MLARALTILAHLALASVLFGSLGWGGGTSPAALRAFALASGVALALAIAATRAEERAATVRPVHVLLFVIAAVVALQLMPWPSVLVARVDPAGSRLVELLGASPRIGLTLDRGATWLELARAAGLTAFALAAHLLAGLGRRAMRAILVGLVTALLAIVALDHLGLPPPAPLVAEAPHEALVRSPLRNPNHLGVLLAALLPLLWSVAARARGLGRVGASLLIPIANLVVVGTRSRAALALACVAQALALFALLPRRYRRRRVVVALVGGALALALGGALALRGELSASSPGQRLATWIDALHLLREHPSTGVGAGAFGLLFPRFGRAAGQVHHAFVENQYLQAAIELGLPAWILLAALASFVLVRALRARLDDPLARAATIGLGVLLVHNLVDFSGYGAAVAAVGATLLALRTGGEGRPLASAWLAVIALFPIGAAWASARPERSTPPEALAALEQTLPALGAAQIEAQGHEVFLLHPCDRELSLTLASRLITQDAARALPWIERALLLAPRDPRAHLLAASALLAARAPEQAAIELRVAIGQAGDRDRGPALELAQRLFGTDPKLLDRALPVGGARLRVGVARTQLAHGNAAAARSLIDHVLDETPDDAEALTLSLAAGLALDEPGKVLEARARRLAEHPSRDAQAVIAAARALERAEARRDALVLLETELSRAVMAADKVRLLQALAELEEHEGRNERAAYHHAEAARLQR